MTAPNHTPLNPSLLGPETEETLAYLTRNVIGQPDAIRTVGTVLQQIKAGLREAGRPASSFLFMGPTGVGKSRMVEAISESLHGSPKNLITVHCAEYQLDHEVAKLIGAPPGYLGHRETQPVFTQQKLAMSISDKFAHPVILFDEIEKAAPSFIRFLLGILDKGVLRLGDNTTVNFEKAIIFLTSNLGSKELSRQHDAAQYFAPTPAISQTSAALSGERAAKKNFSPEFWNRLDRVVVFEHLKAPELAKILDLELNKLELRGAGRFLLNLSQPLKDYILEQGTSMAYGARELKRTLDRVVTDPLANLLVSGQIPPFQEVLVGLAGNKAEFSLGSPGAAPEPPSPPPTKTTRAVRRPVMPFTTSQL